MKDIDMYGENNSFGIVTKKKNVIKWALWYCNLNYCQQVMSVDRGMITQGPLLTTSACRQTLSTNQMRLLDRFQAVSMVPNIRMYFSVERPIMMMYHVPYADRLSGPLFWWYLAGTPVTKAGLTSITAIWLPALMTIKQPQSTYVWITTRNPYLMEGWTTMGHFCTT